MPWPPLFPSFPEPQGTVPQGLGWAEQPGGRGQLCSVLTALKVAPQKQQEVGLLLSRVSGKPGLCARRTVSPWSLALTLAKQGPGRRSLEWTASTTHLALLMQPLKAECAWRPFCLFPSEPEAWWL